jgi:hypothetical protein
MLTALRMLFQKKRRLLPESKLELVFCNCNNFLVRRTEYYRLVEQFKVQVKEKQDVVEKMTIEDANKMREQLKLRNQILELEKRIEKETNANETVMHDKIGTIRNSNIAKREDGDVKVEELKENLLAMKDLERKKQVYEAEIYQWEHVC